MVWEYKGNIRTPGPLRGVPGALGGRAPGPLRSGPKTGPGGGTATKTADEVPPPPNLGGDGTSATLNQEVATAAATMVGKSVVGPTGQPFSDTPDDAQCFYLVDVLLKRAGAFSANDIDPVTGKQNQDYQWSKIQVDLADVKPGDLLQFRDHETEIETATKTTKKSGGKLFTPSTPESHKRGPQHSAIVLKNNGDGTLEIAEQHVLEPGTKKESTTVRKNTLYTRDVPATTTTRHEGGDTIETTTTITVSGKIWAYRPQKFGDGRSRLP